MSNAAGAGISRTQALLEDRDVFHDFFCGDEGVGPRGGELGPVHLGAGAGVGGEPVRLGLLRLRLRVITVGDGECDGRPLAAAARARVGLDEPQLILRRRGRARPGPGARVPLAGRRRRRHHRGVRLDHARSRRRRSQRLGLLCGHAAGARGPPGAPPRQVAWGSPGWEAPRPSRAAGGRDLGAGTVPHRRRSDQLDGEAVFADARMARNLRAKHQHAIMALALSQKQGR